MKKIAIYGAGGFGREVHSLIEHINLILPTWEFIGYFDDGISKGKIINGKPILGGLKEAKEIGKINMIIALGSPVIKQRIVNNLDGCLIYFPVLIHPQAIVPHDSSIFSVGEGAVITAGCILSVNTKIGKHVLINVNTTVGHDVEINNYCSIMPSCKISGEVTIGEKCFIGVGSTLLNQISIEDNVTIGAGSVVLKSVTEKNVTLMGNPARIMLKN
jgi:sugar O-acyltransferase (sialic acid O-acetyltransferase NeuD family)